MLKTLAKRTILVLAIILLVSIAYSWTTRAKPVLYSYREPGGLTRGNLIFLLNPFRDRGPEEAGKMFLNSLQEGNYAVLLSSLEGATDEWLSDFSEKEAKYGIVNWRLVDRVDLPEEVRLYFLVAREYGLEVHESPVCLTVEKSMPGPRWAVTGYEAWY